MNSEFGGLLNNLPKAPEAKPAASHRADSASAVAKKPAKPADAKGFESLLSNKAPEKAPAKTQANKSPASQANQPGANQVAAASQNKPAPRPQAAPAAANPRPATPTKATERAINDEPRPVSALKPKTKMLSTPDEMAVDPQVASGQMAQVQPQVLATAAAPQLVDVKTIAAVLGRGDVALKANPTLSFLAGKLENISPEMIPAIITDSKFITNALSQADINGLLKQPVPMDGLLADLGFAPQQLEALADLGIDLKSPITPAKLLATIGVDPGSVGAELHMLKDNLQLEGMVPYLTRAARMQAPTQPVKANNLAQQPLAAGAGSQPLRAQTALSPSDPFSPAVVPLSNEPMPGLQGVASEPAPSLNPYAGLANTNTNTNTATPTIKGPKVATTAPASAPRLDGVDLKALSTTPDVYQLQYQNFDERFSRLATDRISFDKPGITESPSLDLSAPAPLPKGDVVTAKDLSDRSEVSDLNLQMPAAFDMNANDSINTPKTQTPNLNSSIERLVASQLAFASKGHAQGEQSNPEGGRKEEFFGVEALDGDALKADQTIGQGSASAAKFQDQLDGVKAEPLSTTKASEHAKNIADLVNQKAQMLTNQGGGSVLLDLGTPETGKLEIALDVTKDGVGMKVLTASEQVKDILMADIPKLRDALSAQSLDLKQVDFGFKRDFNSHQQHQQNQAFQQQQQFNDGQRQGFNQFANQRSPSFNLNRFQTPINNIRSVAMNMPTHSGNIQVLA